MLSKPIASGAMLVLLIGVVGAAALQSDDTAPSAGVTQVETPDDDAAPVEREATAPNRVVDSAGFPVSEESSEDEVTSGPVVTINGRPLGQPTQTAGGSSAVSAGERAEQPGPSYSIQDDDATQTQTAVIEPPRPIPRPAGLTAAPRDPISTAGTGGQAASGMIDYDATVNAPFGIPAEPPMTLDQRQDLLPPANLGNHPATENGVVRDPERDELVGVVGPSGQVIWIYEEQLRNNDSRVTFQTNQPAQNPAPLQNSQPVNPFGFVYE